MTTNQASILAPIIDPLSLRELRPAPRRALFLDRDGVINRDHGYVHTETETEWMPGIFELVGIANDHGVACIVVTNQAGIARGFYDEGSFRRYTQWVHGEFRARDVPLLATYFCPHHPSIGLSPVSCVCRKPAPGMLMAALREFDIDPARSFMIGDRPSDIRAASAASIGKSMLVATEDVESDGMADSSRVDSIQQAVPVFLSFLERARGE